jgi:hypothetical protein
MLSDAGIERQEAVETGACLGHRSTAMKVSTSALSLSVVRLPPADLLWQLVVLASPTGPGVEKSTDMGW